MDHGPTYTYMLLFRNGIIEGVESNSLIPRSDGNLKGMKFFFTFHHAMLIEALGAALKTYQKLAIPTPIFGAVTFTGIRDYLMYIDPMYHSRGGIAMNRDILALPEFIIEDLNVDPLTALKPTFDVCGRRADTMGYLLG